ncbi:MAG TPA: spore photoproduct lyase [Ruminococcaceae bacterium]|nr:spore photoproduct lyase [Oscillospiraceae bacterium]
MQPEFDAVYYEPKAMEYELGKRLREKYKSLPWIEIESHNRIPMLSAAEDADFPKLKRHLVLGIRKTHRYAENHKVSDWLVPYTSSGCRAMCMYCYLMCSYNKCSYMRLFVNREEMLERLLRFDARTAKPQTFEIGSNSDLVLENSVTGNLGWTIERFGKKGRGNLTFPTKFDMVQPLLSLNHRGKVIFRMSVNPAEIVSKVELGTSQLRQRIKALNEMAHAGYRVGILIAPVILLSGWKRMYGGLIDELSDELAPEVKQKGFIEIILMTYSFVQDAINTSAFPGAVQIFDRSIMRGRGRGKYCYRSEARAEAESFLRGQISEKLGMPIIYIA